jgi:quercetin dioxygenase-like cupin family protein
MNVQPQVVNKGWGSELIFANGEYCGKLLRFNKGGKSSMHFHVHKRETWYVSKGSLMLTTINPADAECSSRVISEGDVIENIPGHPHQLEAIEESIIFEVSTRDFEGDSYRIAKGDSQK